MRDFYIGYTMKSPCRGKSVKVTDCVDCLSPDVSQVKRASFETASEVLAMCDGLVRAGWDVDKDFYLGVYA